jgi:hypothetical protein
VRHYSEIIGNHIQNRMKLATNNQTNQYQQFIPQINNESHPFQGLVIYLV